MTQIEPNQNFQMIHIASELVALIGVTFYFTSKYNSLNQDIKKMQNIIQQQHSKIQNMDNQIRELYNLIQKLNNNNYKPIINESFKNPVDVFAQVIGVSDISQPQHTQSQTKQTQHLPFENNLENNLENNKSNIEIIDDSKNNQNDINQNGLDTESELDDQLVAELSELHHSENKSNQVQAPVQAPVQVPVQLNKPDVNITTQNSETNKIQPIQQNNVLIDFLNTNSKKSPSNTSQLSVQDDMSN